MPDKKSGLGLKYLVTSTNKKYLSSLHASSELIGYITENKAVSTAKHLLDLREERRDKKIQYGANKEKIKGLVKDLEAFERCLILCVKNTGSWLTVWGTKVIITVFAATEFSYFCALVMILLPLTSKKCESCSLSFSVHHGMSFRN